MISTQGILSKVDEGGKMRDAKTRQRMGRRIAVNCARSVVVIKNTKYVEEFQAVGVLAN
jgi:hypothetical protein